MGPCPLCGAPTTSQPFATGNQAKSPRSAQNLARQLTSEEQLAQASHGVGTPLIGAGTNKKLQAAEKLAREYGGNPSDWVKMGSENSARHSVSMPNGKNFETHWYHNVKTRANVEFKTKIDGH